MTNQPPLAERDEAIVQMRLAGHTLQAIGDVYGLTRERVRQLLIGRIEGQAILNHCQYCGKPFSSRRYARRVCSRACSDKAYKQRKAAA